MRLPNILILCLLILLSTQLLLPKALPAASFYDKYYKRNGYEGWKYIVIHHSATDSGSAKAFHKYHTDNGWGGLCYHFIIGNGNGTLDGAVETGFRWKQQIAGTHCTVKAWEYNFFGIGICLVGNFEKAKPTEKQMESLLTLVARLMKKHNIPLNQVIGHKEVPYDDDPSRFEATVCPGKLFPMNEFKKRLRQHIISN
jgi:N-acetyl-anhydromuramyl-L-alanine amidase AmpD